MTPDLLAETRLSFGQLARQEGVNPTTVWRWAARGVKGVRLETYLRAGRRFTTKEAFARFCAATTAAADGGPMLAPTSTKQREAEIRRAEVALTKAGV